MLNNSNPQLLAASSSGGSVNLAAGWQTVWGGLSSSIGPLTTILTAVGAILVVSAVIGYLWERKKGGGGRGHEKLFFVLLIGAILAAPNLLIPVILTIVDVIVNGIVGIAQGLGGG